jgi:glucose/mannose transport system substrate-binding protein
MRRSLGVLVCFAVGNSGVGCAEASYCQVPTQQVVEMFSWWTQTGETLARQKLVDMHEARMKLEQQPTWVNATTMDNNSFARSFLSRGWTSKHRLPDTFQVNIGQELLGWKDDRDALEPVDFLLDEQPALRDKFFKGVLAEASSDGALYGIPLNIHRKNTLFYNKVVLDELVRSNADIDTLEEFEELCVKLKANHPQRSPIALGTKGAAWTLGLLAHEALYPSMWGVQQYRSLWRGATTDQAEEYFQRLWAVYEKLLDWKHKGWLNADYAEISWTDAANRLFATDDSQAAFYIMGDWVQAEPALSDHVTQLGRTAFPAATGVDSVFVYTADTFPLPRSTKNRENAVELLRTMTRPDVQIAFSQKKGSIPARDDLLEDDRMPYNEAYVEFLVALKKHQAVLDVSGCLRDNEMPSNDEQVLTMLDTGNIEGIKTYWLDVYNVKPNRTCFQYE